MIEMIAAPSQIVAINEILDRFPASVRTTLANAGIKIVVLRSTEAFADVSPVMRTAGVSAWPIPPAGVFVLQEGTVYVRAVEPMTIAHELGHAYDYALGNRTHYWSSLDPRIRRAFATATRFVTPYAASAVDEYFAECLRAFVSVNSPRSLWPNATRERLHESDPTMERILADLLGEPEPAESSTTCAVCRTSTETHDETACRAEYEA